MSSRRAACVAALAAAVAAGACTPPLPPPPAPPAQEPGSTVIEGDSITVQWALGGGAVEGAEVNAGLGWTIDDCLEGQNPGCAPATEHLAGRVAAGRADRVVLALGSNDAASRNGGWTDEDVVRWQATINLIPSGSCVVLVAPWASEAYDPTSRAGYEAAEAWMLGREATRPNTVAVSWRGPASAPGVLHTDGLHLANGPQWPGFGISPDAAAARDAALEAGLARCA